MYFFQGLTIRNREDQGPSVEPLVNHFSTGPPTHGQPRLSVVVVGGPKWYDSNGPPDPKINYCQDPASITMTTKLLSLSK